MIELPDDRCGFSDRGHTCVTEAWHEGFHRLVPSSWIRHNHIVPDVAGNRSDIDELERLNIVEEHAHVWGPFGCYCGAQQPEPRQSRVKQAA